MLAYFSIDGGWLTGICRDFVLEGKWRHALATFTEGLEGISTDQAILILRGQYRLEGVNTIDLVEDNTPEAAEYLETLAWQYAGLWHRAGIGEFLPYALVTHLAAEDVPDFPRIPLSSEKWDTARLLYYADDPKKDICTDIAMEDSGVGIIWRKVEDPPLWIRGAGSHCEAMDAFNAAGKWLERRSPQKEIDSYYWRATSTRSTSDRRNRTRICLQGPATSSRTGASTGAPTCTIQGSRTGYSSTSSRSRSMIPRRRLTVATGFVFRRALQAAT